MKNNRLLIATVLDTLAVAFGCAIWILMFIFPDMCCLRVLTLIAGVIGFAYIVYAFCLICKRPSFDWHLIHGNFLHKAICLVVLMPFVFSIFVPGDLNPEELAYEDVLYESYVNQHALKITLRPESDKVSFDAGIGIFGQQIIPSLVMYFVAWPVLLTQIWGMVQQSQLDDKALLLAESVVPSDPSSPRVVEPTSVSSFCPQCGGKHNAGMKFCPNCGEKL